MVADVGDAIRQYQFGYATPVVVPRAGAACEVVHSPRAGDGQRQGGVGFRANRHSLAVLGQRPCQVVAARAAVYFVADCCPCRLCGEQHHEQHRRRPLIESF